MELHSFISSLASPTELSTLAFYSLVLLSCVTSMISASMGIGGGTVLLAVMAQVIPIKAIIPVHGVVGELVFIGQFGRRVGGWANCCVLARNDPQGNVGGIYFVLSLGAKTIEIKR